MVETIVHNRGGLAEMSVLAAVADAGSFSAAARLLRMTPSAVSKLVARVEARLGVRLVDRNTHGLALTAEGEIYVATCRQVLDALAAVEQRLTRRREELVGTLRVSAAGPVAFHLLAPVLPAFLDLHPKLRLDLDVSSSLVDLVAERVDVAVRAGPLDDSTLLARRLGTSRLVKVAAPDHLAQRGGGAAAERIGFNFRRAFEQPTRSGGDRTGGRFTTSSGEMLRLMTLAGVGSAWLARYHVMSDIDAGRLVVIDDGAGLDEPISAVFLPHKQDAPRIRAFVAFLVDRLSLD